MKFVITPHPQQFPERKTGNESGECDELRQIQWSMWISRNASKRSTMDNPFDNFFDKVKGERKQAEHECLVDRGLIRV